MLRTEKEERDKRAIARAATFEERNRRLAENARKEALKDFYILD